MAVLYRWYELSRVGQSPATAAANCNCWVEAQAVASLGTTVAEKSASTGERVIWQRPYCRVVRLARALSAERAAQAPRILILTPYWPAARVEAAARALLARGEVFVTDWRDARELPVSAGPFDLETYIDTAGDLIRSFDGDVHVLALGYAGGAALAAIARMEANGEVRVPLSLILAGAAEARGQPSADFAAPAELVSSVRTAILDEYAFAHGHRGRAIDLGAIRRVALMTVDAIARDGGGRGQCRAAHQLCHRIPDRNRFHFESTELAGDQPFAGAVFANEIVPRLARFVRRHDPRCGTAPHISHRQRRVASACTQGSARMAAAALFAFAPANDRRCRVPDTGRDAVSKARPQRIGPEWLGLLWGLGTEPLRFWTVAGSCFLDGVARVLGMRAAALGGREKRAL